MNAKLMLLILNTALSTLMALLPLFYSTITQTLFPLQERHQVPVLTSFLVAVIYTLLWSIGLKLQLNSTHKSESKTLPFFTTSLIGTFFAAIIIFFANNLIFFEYPLIIAITWITPIILLIPSARKENKSYA